MMTKMTLKVMKCIGLLNTYRLTQKKGCQVHSNAHKPPKTVALTVWMLE